MEVTFGYLNYVLITWYLNLSILTLFSVVYIKSTYNINIIMFLIGIMLFNESPASTPGLLNSLSTAHPWLLLYCYSTFIIIFGRWYNICKFYTLSLILCILLGGWWAFQELTWGGWWNWDVIEVSIGVWCVYFILIKFHLIGYIHKYFRHYKYLMILLLLNTYITRFVLTNSVHVFIIQTSSYNLYKLVLILIFNNYIWLLVIVNYIANISYKHIGQLVSLCIVWWVFYFILFMFKIKKILSHFIILLSVVLFWMNIKYYEIFEQLQFQCIQLEYVDILENILWVKPVPFKLNGNILHLYNLIN